MLQKFVAYTRVSSERQSTHGASLFEQRRAITQYVERRNIQITHWYEEVESASKGKRVVFREVLKLLQYKRSLGLVMHKIDRGARSLRDWADIGDLIDAGIDVRFAHDDLDLDTRGGRLTADIQAVIAADYIRNLREEVRKGIQGRLHQGLYPFKAPIGYRDRGGGRVKTPDAVFAPLVVEVFKRYASGIHTLRSLAAEIAILGLTQKDGAPVTPYTISRILRCHFYVGEYRVGGITYLGIHQPLLTRDLFNQGNRPVTALYSSGTEAPTIS